MICTGPRPKNGLDAAVLAGTIKAPYIELRFEFDDTHATNGDQMVAWVKSLADRRWDPDNPHGKCWVATGFGSEPSVDLGLAGFGDYVIDMDDTDGLIPDDITVDDLVAPIVELSDRHGYAIVWPRFFGFMLTKNLLGGVGRWDNENRRFEVPVSAFPIKGLDAPDDVLAAAEQVEAERAAVDVHAGTVGGAISLEAAGAHGEALYEMVGGVPAWFGLELDPYQEAGAIAVAAGHALLADEMGLGKTRQAIAAAAILRSKRTVICVPPVTVTGWVREIIASHLHEFAQGSLDAGADGQGLAPPTDDATVDPSAQSILAQRNGNGPDSSSNRVGAGNKATKKAAAKPKGRKKLYPEGIAVFVSGRKEPELPETGVIIIPDSILTSRPALLNKLCAWKPDVVIVDEAHRAMTWSSGRSKALRKMAGAARKQGIAMTGTPFFASVVEMAGPLAISGHLDTVFGGLESYRSTFARQNNFNAWVTRKQELPTLYRALNKSVWVRRNKVDVAKELPPKRRVPKYIDVDLTLFREAHNECIGIIDAWIDDFELDEGRLPTPSELASWAKGEISLVTRLRRAAGLAKTPRAVEMIAEWVETHSVEGSNTYDRPLIVWAHHKEVVDALVEAVPERFPAARAIVGSTSRTQRSLVIDDYQAGKIPVLIASIGAAGVGITLTRGCDAIFVETDYTPALVAQAEDRQARRGQTRPVTCTTLIAPGTLDERIQGVLNAKFEILKAVMPGMDADVSVTDNKADESTTPHKIIVELGLERLAKRTPKAAARPAA